MKRIIRKYLFERPTLFPWLTVLLLLATVFYMGIGIVGIFEHSEAMMGFLFLMVTVPCMIILGVSDYLLRRLFPLKLLPIWLTEIFMLTVFGLWYYRNHFYETRFITERGTPLFVMVEDSIEGIEVRRGGLLQFKTVYSIPADNVIFVKEFPRENEWARLKAETRDGRRYNQVYPMNYKQKDTLQCNGLGIEIQFFMLESDSIPRFLFTDKQLDSMRAITCRKATER